MILEEGYRYMMYNKMEKMKQSLIDIQDAYRNEISFTDEVTNSVTSKLNYLAWEIQTLAKQVESDRLSGKGIKVEEG